jgi:hypothetical protein
MHSVVEMQTMTWLPSTTSCAHPKENKRSCRNSSFVRAPPLTRLQPSFVRAPPLIRLQPQRFPLLSRRAVPQERPQPPMPTSRRRLRGGPRIQTNLPFQIQTNLPFHATSPLPLGSLQSPARNRRMMRFDVPVTARKNRCEQSRAANQVRTELRVLAESASDQRRRPGWLHQCRLKCKFSRHAASRHNASMHHASAYERSSAILPRIL